MAEISCSEASSQFRRETRATRRCLSNGMWAAADLTSCTLRSDPEPFLLVWFVIEIGGESDGIMTPIPEGFAADGTPDSETRQDLETEVYLNRNFGLGYVVPNRHYYDIDTYMYHNADHSRGYPSPGRLSPNPSTTFT